LPFVDIEKELENESFKIIKPFNYFAFLKEQESIDFINKKKVVVGPETHKTITNFGAGSFIIDQNTLKNNPFNEQFRGWGYEDLEFERRILEKHEVKELSYTGIHLFHKVDHKNFKNNKTIFENLNKNMS